jgi:hypothetical protein
MMTVQEMQTLPIGPAFGMRTEIIDGKKVNIPRQPGCRRPLRW